MANICPVCGKDDAIQRVAALVAAGQSSGTFSGPSGGVTHSDGKWGTVSGYSTLSGSTSSDLARLLALPKEPVMDIGTLESGCGTALILGGGLLAILLLFDSFTNALVVFLIFGGLGVLFGRSAAQKKKISDEQRPHAIAKWEKAKAYWERLYFCHRDGIVFDPENSKTCQPSQIKEFIYE